MGPSSCPTLVPEPRRYFTCLHRATPEASDGTRDRLLDLCHYKWSTASHFMAVLAVLAIRMNAVSISGSGMVELVHREI